MMSRQGFRGHFQITAAPRGGVDFEGKKMDSILRKQQNVGNWGSRRVESGRHTGERELKARKEPLPENQGPLWLQV